MIFQADTYHYDMKHFGECPKCPDGVAGACFNNVFMFEKHYAALNKQMDIVLSIGGRSFDSSSVFCYHFLLQDKDTLEYIDPQYRRYTFLPLHKWSLDDYSRETKEFEEKQGYTHAEEFAAWYCENFADYIEAGCLMIRAMANYRKPSKKTIREHTKELVGYGVKPEYGESLVKTLMFG